MQMWLLPVARPSFWKMIRYYQHKTQKYIWRRTPMVALFSCSIPPTLFSIPPWAKCNPYFEKSCKIKTIVCPPSWPCVGMFTINEVISDDKRKHWECPPKLQFIIRNYIFSIVTHVFHGTEKGNCPGRAAHIPFLISSQHHVQWFRNHPHQYNKGFMF